MAHTRRFLSLLAGALLFLAAAPGSALAADAPAAAAPAQAGPCRFVLGFASLAAALPRVGSCTGNQSFAPNGDAQQQTSGGLLVWRKEDNFTAFTDGYRSWVAGPNGVQVRLNTERFPWELQGSALLAAGASRLYKSGLRGWDVSYPQCRTAAPPPGTFGVAGANGGRPFSTNPCATTQYAWAAGAGSPPALYLNTGYLDSYKAHITAECRAMAGAQGDAWAVGCSEAQYAVEHAPGAASMWWLDVETGNSWSNDLSLNRQTIQGAVAWLQQRTDALVGIYANSTQWGKITGPGGWGPSGNQATWVAPSHVNAGSAPIFCGQPFMGGAPVWLVQYPGNHVDANYAC